MKHPTGPHTMKPSQLMPGEIPMLATLANGETATVLYRKGGDLFTQAGRPGNFGGCGDAVMPQTWHFGGTLPDGRRLALFVNVETGLVVVDLFNKAETGGLELIRKNFPAIVSRKEKQGREFVLESLEAD